MRRPRHATTVLALVGLSTLLSCAHTGTPPDAPAALTPLRQLSVKELGDRVRVEVHADRPIAYSMSSSVVPPSVTVQIPGFGKTESIQAVAVKKGPIVEIVPSEVQKPTPGTQLHIRLNTAMVPDLRAEGDRLLIDFPLLAAASATAPAESVGETAGPAAAPPVGPPAHTMTKVEVQRGDTDTTVVIYGDGVFSYDVRRLSGDRLVLDLANVESALRTNTLPVDHPLLKQIRIGQHAQKVRLVFDLQQLSAYVIRPGSNQLSVTLSGAKLPEAGEAAKRPVEPVAAEPPAPTPAVRVAVAGRVPFPERLAMLEARPLAQMAPDAKGSDEPDDLGQRRYVGRRISLDFQAADISNVLRLIAEVSGFNIVVGENVKNKVTLKLIGVPWDQALDMLLKMNNLGMIREGNIVWIDTLANIARQQDEEARAKESKIKAEDLITRIIYVQNVTAQEIQTTLRQYLSPRGQLNVNAASNALVIQDTESRVGAFTELVRSLDLEVPQVQIEARIVQADTSYARALGIQWGIANRSGALNNQGTSFIGNQTGAFSEQQTDSRGTITRTFNVNLPAVVPGLSAVPAVGYTFGKINTGDGFTLDLRLSAGELLGLTKVIAAPKITTLDKREAKIEQGESIPFQTTSLQGTQTTFVDANLTLQVTPQITSRDPKEVGKNVLLRIRATRNAVGARSNPAGPSIDKREANTQVLVRDGETMVIGGIFVDAQSNTVSGIPYLSRIPVLGWLFKSKQETISKQELLIFLTPTIVKS